MSMSTQNGGGTRQPSTTRPGGKPTAELDTEADLDTGTDTDAKAEAAETGLDPKAGQADARSKPTSLAKDAKTPAGRSPRSRPANAGKGGGRRPVVAVRVNQSRNWGPIALFSAVGLLAAGIIGFAGWQVYTNGLTPQERADRIDGLVDYRKTDKSLKDAGKHAWGPLKYKQSPPVGGTHNFNWQNCSGDVYDAPVANEHAVHSMEHGAVWITYNPDKLTTEQVEALAKKVRGKDYLMISPYPGLDRPFSMQSWGYQLKLDSVTDARVDEFIKVTRTYAGIEPGAACSGGITETGTTPRDLGKDKPLPRPTQ